MAPAKPAALMMSAMDWLLLVLLSLLWGGSFYFAKVAVLEIPPLTLAFVRVLIAAAFLAILVRAMGGSFPRDPRLWRDLTIMAALNNALPFTLIFWGQIYIPIGLASIFNAISPLFTVVVAHFATQDDKLSPGRVLGLAAGFIGVVILIGPDMLAEFGTHVWAELACLVASCSYAFGAVYARRLKAQSPFFIATGQLTMAAVLLLPLALLVDRPWLLEPPSSAAIWATLALAVLSTALAYLLYFRILVRAGATNALLVTFLIPVSAILLGILLLDEAIEPRQLAGMAAIALGLAAIDGRPAQFLTNSLARTTR
jgi:drug/metabolite transporter (DMT)-like permease